MTNYQNKKGFERWIIDLFVSTIPELISATVVECENPDFLLRTGQITIGLELTCLLDETLSERDTAQQRVVERSKELYDKQGLPPIHVDVMFIDHRFPARRDVDATARQIVRAIVSHMPPMDEHVTIKRNYRYHHDDSYLPKQVAFISLCRSHVMDHSFFGRMDGGFARLITPQLVQDTISVKNRRVSAYLNRCATAWLVIAYDTGGMKSLFKPAPEVALTQYESKFSRMFLFNRFTKMTTELTIKDVPNKPSEATH